MNIAGSIAGTVDQLDTVPMGRTHSLAFGIEAIDVVACIGDEHFLSRVLKMLDRLFGADQCAVYRYEAHQLDCLAEIGDEAADQLKSLYEVRRLIMSASNLARIWANPVRRSPANTPLSQEVFIYQRVGGAGYCIRSLCLRRRAELTDADIAHTEALAPLLLAAVARHMTLVEKRPETAPALASLDRIEDCLASASTLSRREREVCARILFGCSSKEIAADLGIGKESVVTYRKRAYGRLGICSQRELLMWYLASWCDQGDESIEAAVAA